MSVCLQPCSVEKVQPLKRGELELSVVDFPSKCNDISEGIEY